MKKNKVVIPVIILTLIIIAFIIIIKPHSILKKISISESKWNSIIESRNENKRLVIESIKFNDHKLIVDEKNNTIYYSINNENKNEYNPRVEYYTNEKNIKLAFLSDEITEEKIKNNYQFKLIIYNEEEYRIYNLEYTNLPILNINYNISEESKQKSIPMDMYLFDNFSTTPNRITISRGKLKINEENFIFSLHTLTPGKNKRENKISILGMKPDSEFILAPISNNSENLTHKVLLFVNNEYRGVYSVIGIDDRKKEFN